MYFYIKSRKKYILGCIKKNRYKIAFWDVFFKNPYKIAFWDVFWGGGPWDPMGGSMGSLGGPGSGLRQKAKSVFNIDYDFSTTFNPHP